VVHIFTDTVAGWYRRRHVEHGLPAGDPVAVWPAVSGVATRPPTAARLEWEMASPAV
jgi:hypothetical protein